MAAWKPSGDLANDERCSEKRLNTEDEKVRLRPTYDSAYVTSAKLHSLPGFAPAVGTLLQLASKSQ
jgi:hypothetical protein